MSQLYATFLIKWSLALELMQTSHAALPSQILIVNTSVEKWCSIGRIWKEIPPHLNRNDKEFGKGAVRGNACHSRRRPQVWGCLSSHRPKGEVSKTNVFQTDPKSSVDLEHSRVKKAHFSSMRVCSVNSSISESEMCDRPFKNVIILSNLVFPLLFALFTNCK